jgi:hypothetical protein
MVCCPFERIASAWHHQCLHYFGQCQLSQVFASWNATKSEEKKDLQDACTEYGIEFASTDVKSVWWGKLEAYIEINIVLVVVSMARLEGHIVLYTPPHHSTLQPIETVWAITRPL